MFYLMTILMNGLNLKELKIWKRKQMDNKSCVNRARDADKGINIFPSKC